jgi:hypothetical protein
MVTLDYGTVQQYVNGGDVETVTIDGCGEILYDALRVTYGIELDNGVIIGNVNTWRDVLEYIERWDVERVVVYHDNVLQHYINVNAPQPQPVQLTVETWDTQRGQWTIGG